MWRNPTMEVSCEFFERPLKEYTAWPVKWWREVIQNAVDAGASRVDLAAFENTDGTWTVSCKDDGTGMSWDIFKNVFLKIGPTSKKNPWSRNPIGGFGKARELIILPWIHWRVVSGGFAVTGQGMQYDEPMEVGRTVGTLVEVIMPADRHTSSVEAMEFIQNCELSGIKFYINGEQFADKLRATKRVVDFDFGDLYQNKSQYRYKVIVRVNGLYMFSTGYTPEGMGAFVLELKTPPDASSVNDILTATRDDFRDYRHRNALDTFLESLTSEREQALKQRSGLFTKIWKGEGKFRVEQTEQMTQDIEREIERSLEDKEALAQALIEMAREFKRSGRLPVDTGPSEELIIESMNTNIRGCSDIGALAQQLAWTQDFAITCEIEGYRVPKKFEPETMGPQVKALARLWADCCRWVFMQLNSKAEYGIGFIFSEDEYGGGTLAQFRHDENGNWLLINPLVAGKNSEKILSKSNRDNVKDIYARAVHECTHMANGFHKHDSAFSAALTHNFALCADGFPAVMRIARGIKLDEAPEKPARQEKPAKQEPTQPARVVLGTVAKEDDRTAHIEMYSTDVFSTSILAAVITAYKRTYSKTLSIADVDALKTIVWTLSGGLTDTLLNYIAKQREDMQRYYYDIPTDVAVAMVGLLNGYLVHDVWIEATRRNLGPIVQVSVDTTTFPQDVPPAESFISYYTYVFLTQAGERTYTNVDLMDFVHFLQAVYGETAWVAIDDELAQKGEVSIKVPSMQLGQLFRWNSFELA